MFTAEEASQAVGEYYKRGEELSAEWMDYNVEKAMDGIKSASNKGKTEFEYSTNLQTDPYIHAKVKMMHHLFLNLGYKVAVSDKVVADGNVMKRTDTVFTISWS